ncbi:MAG: T9SS type A sorting domain-containing protein, partial [Ignavibacteriaceae bacterium]
LKSLTYQWQKNGVNIPGATSSEYTTNPLTLSDYNSTYRVIVSNSQGSDTSRTAILHLTLITIPAPTNLAAIKYHADTTKVDLSWNDNSPNELGFIIQRKLGDSASVSSYVNIDTVGADVTAFTDSTTMDTTKYTYRIFAYDADTTSDYSNVATVTTPLPVELTSFTASSVNGKMVIEWQTATEINNAGFSIERSLDNQKFSEVAFIKGKGTSTEKSLYRYIDNSASSGKYYYRLKQIDFDGTYSYSKTVEVDLGLPKNYALDQNYPNPFNPTTTIRFATPTNAKVSIKLYNTLGQEVKNLFTKEVGAGVHETQFDASNLSSGIYFYRIEAHGNNGSSYTATKRMLLLK